MLLSYQMISVYQLYIVEDCVHQTKTEAAGTATMSIITMVVSLTASLISGPISSKMHAQGTGHHRLAAVRDWHRDAVDHAERHGHVPVCGHRRLRLRRRTQPSTKRSTSTCCRTRKRPVRASASSTWPPRSAKQSGPTITSVVKTTTGTYTPAFAISIVMAVCAAVFVLRIQKVK